LANIDEYLGNVQPSQRAEYERIRKIVLETVPEAIEGISYNMPSFRYRDQNLIWVGAFKKHMSIFPPTVKFTPEHPLPESTIKEILRARLAAIDHA